MQVFYTLYFILFIPKTLVFKGSGQPCKVAELNMQYCRQILKDSFES